MVAATLIASLLIASAGEVHPVHNDPLTLADCIRAALERNRNLLNSRDSVATAQFRQDAVAARFKTRLTPELSLSSSHTDYELNDESGETDQDAQDYRISAHRLLGWSGATLSAGGGVSVLDGDSATIASIGLQQPIMRGIGPVPTLDPLIDARRATQGAERFSERIAEFIVYDTISAYFAVLRTYQIVEINQRALVRDRDLLDASRARLEIGRATKLDVLRAEMQVLEDENAVVAAQESLGNSYDTIKLLLAADVTEPIALTDRIPAAPSVAPERQCIDMALANRADYAEAVDAVDDADRKLKVARNGLLPILNVDVQYSWFDAGSGFGNGLVEEDRWTIGLVGTQTLDRAEELAAHRTAKKTVEIAHRWLDGLRDSITREIRIELREIERTLSQMSIQKTNVDQAVERIELARLRYERGLEDNFAVVDAQDELVRAEVGLLNAKIDHLLAIARLMRDAGVIDEPEVYRQFCSE